MSDVSDFAIQINGVDTWEVVTGTLYPCTDNRYDIGDMPTSSGYEPMHIPAWWHEEYLKSLEPKPPFDLFAFFDALANDFKLFFADFACAIYRVLSGDWSKTDD